MSKDSRKLRATGSAGQEETAEPQGLNSRSLGGFRAAGDELVLIDTSVWIEAIRRGGDEECRRLVGELIESGRAATCEVVIAELLRGARDEQQAEDLAQALRGLEVLEMGGCGEIAGCIGRKMRQLGLTQPIGDVLIVAVAAMHGAAIMHRDKHISEIAQAIGMREILPGERA